MRPPAGAVPLAALAAFLGYSHGVPHLPDPGLWPATAVVAAVGLPLAAALDLSVLTARRARALALVASAAVLAGLAAGATQLDLPAEASAAKVVGAACAGLVAARVIGSPLEAALVSVLVIGVDSYSVFAGPTRDIAAHHPRVLDAFTIVAPGPGGPGAGLGVSDLFFLGLFAAVAVAHRLHAAASGALMAASFGCTYALAVAFDRALPALPLLSLAFLAVNAGPLWRRLQGRG